MSASVLLMSMSLDSCIVGPNDGPDNPGGDQGAVETNSLSSLCSR
ncbi:hypothetical protein [Crystallibacter crystallopoietes]|nr:hypothetical protein [Arthrobacter crystallopoietes]